MDYAASSFARAVKYLKLHFAHKFIRICCCLPGTGYRNVAELGQSLEFSFWLIREFKQKSPVFATRDKLWNCMISYLARDAKITVFEFGVAYGHATKWWLAHCRSIDSYYGFDTFRGLSRPWRHFSAGAFSANGNPPEIGDPRVDWMIGRVEDTVSGEIIEKLSCRTDGKKQCVFIFDLDLFEPTKHVLEQVIPQLKEGDLLYFDEAADWDERRALMEVMGELPVSLQLVGSTPIAMALRVVTG